MLSVASPPDPPCSSTVPALNSDGKGHSSEGTSSSPEADPADGPDEAQHPHFSIRDYVFASRSKDVGTNWPFPQQYLRLFVEHGVGDLLPPFEPPDLVRARFKERHVQVDHLSVCSGVEERQTEVSDAVKCGLSLATQESASGSSQQPRNPLIQDNTAVVHVAGSDDELFHGECESKVTCHHHTRSIPSSVSQFPGSVQESSTVSESSLEVEVAKPPQLAENFGGTSKRSALKKCRLVAKFGGAPEFNRTEETVSNVGSVSDSMASKVCPVCKTFASTSNTTLNAHIDQCLSSESNANWEAIKLSKHKLKPRKERSMEDIYASVPCCTLEDLDRRNGTNWALDFSSITQNNGASCTSKSKQPRISPMKATDDGREGAMYVDSNGTKLLILSKLNDAQCVTAVDCSVPKKCKKEFKNESSPFAKRKCLPPTYRKYLKAKVRRKKMNSCSRYKGEIHDERELHVDMQHEEGMISWASNAPDPKTVRNSWSLNMLQTFKSLKTFEQKICHRKSRNSSVTAHHKSMESDQSTSCDYFAIGHTQKFCKSTGEVSSPPKARITDMLSDTMLASLDQGRHSTDLPERNARSIRNNPSTSNSIMLKLSRSTGKCVSSAKNKRMGMHTNIVQKSGKFQSLRKNSMGCHPQVHEGEKSSRRSISMDGQQRRKEGIKCNELLQGVVSKRLRKHRFSEKPHQPMKELPLELAEAEASHGTPGAYSLASIRNNVTSGMHQSSFLENVMRPKTGNTLGHASPHQRDIVNSNQADVCYPASDGGETLNRSQLEAAHHAKVTEFDAQIEVTANKNSMAKYPLEKSSGTCGSEAAISEDHEATACDRLDSFPSVGHERECSSANEAIIGASIPKLLGDQGMHYGVIASDVHLDISKVGQIDSSVKDGYCCSEFQNMEYQADIASVQFSSACLSGSEDKVLEHGSSMTSGRTVIVEIHNMVVDGEPAGSPVSATSAISYLSVEDLKSKDAVREPSEEPVVIQENLRPNPRNLRLLVDDSMRGTERTNPEKIFQRMKATTSTQDPGDLWDGQPCCCSRRESIPHKYRNLRQSAMAGMMLPTKTKQITSSLYTRPVISSSGTYSHSTSEVKAIPTLDSPTDSISVKVSSDFDMGYPTFGSFELARSLSHIQPQNTSSPILRLMGKNLMVMNSEESFSNLDGTCYPHQSLEGYMLPGHHPSNNQAPIPLQPKVMGCFAGTLLQSAVTMKTDSHAHHKWMDKKPNLSDMFNSEKVCTPHEQQTPIPVTRAPIPERDIIVIDDSPERENEASGSMQNLPSNMAPSFSGSDLRRVRSFSCYPSLNRFQPMELGHGLKSGFPIPCLRHGNTSTNWGSTTGSSGLPLPRHFVAPSHFAGQEATTLYHSLSFQ